ncbi:MAG: hypothetical protein NVS9B14_17190 [Candidatus Acidiferrum sp.]
MSTPSTKPIWKNPLVYSGALLLLVAIYVGWIVFSRWNENRQLEQRARDAAAKKQHEEDQRTVEKMGGSELAIQSFYGNSQIRRGQTAQLCYGVANAKKVTLEPQSNPVWPSYSRCVDVSPIKTTTYTLTASDDAGHSVSQTFTVKVQ